MLKGLGASTEAYQKKINLFFLGIGLILLGLILFTLVMTIGSAFSDFIQVEILQKAIASMIKTSEGVMTLVWYIAYGLPYIIARGGFIYLYE
ncbi:DUF334 domain-containing protein [Staphylococcus epidermidis]